MVPLPWLKRIHRRTLKDKGHRRSPEEIHKLIMGKTWFYKSTPTFYHTRDRAFLSLLYICCGRISEILGVTEEQAEREGTKPIKGLVKRQFEDQGDIILIKNFQVVKTYLFRDEWPLPKEGRLGPFTRLVVAHLKNVENKLFHIGRQRGYQICKHITGMWPHWFRAQGEAFWMTFVKDAYRLATGLRLKDPKTLMEYVPFEWRDYKKQLLSGS